MAGEATSQARSLPKIGSYDLLQPLGSGGMSSVFRARHTETGLEVALKVLPRTLAKNPTVMQRFLREARSAESLEHPNIVAIYDHGVDQGRHYIVLEYVEGGDFHDLVRARGPLDVEEAVRVVRSVAEGLRYAASRGLIHRDIKPANLLSNSAGQVKIADLGLALQADEEDERVTREGTTVGTVDYMAPEQARDSRAISVRSDIYSLGCTFFFLLTGQPPFPGGDVAEKLNKHINVAPPDPRDFRPEIPERLATVIRTMLAKKPEARYANYDELIAALEPSPEAREKSAAPQAAFVPVVATPEPMVALFADDDEDDEIGLVPADDDFQPLTPAPPPRQSDPLSSSNPFSMAELAWLDGEDNQLALPSPRPVRSLSGVVRPSAPLPRLHDRSSEAGLDEPEPLAVVSGKQPMPPAVASNRRMDPSEREWLTKCVLAGLGLVLLVIAADQILRAPSRVESESTPAPETRGEPEGAVPAPPPVIAVLNPGPSTSKVVPKPKEVAKTVPSTPPPPEPGDPQAETVPETSYGPAIETGFLPDWATQVPRVGDKLITVKRLPDPKANDQAAGLQAALGLKSVGIIELADNGPFFEDDLRMTGDARVIRARPGHRPIVVLQRSPGNLAIRQDTFLELSDKSLVFEGLDLVVDLASLPHTMNSLFECRGGELTLRDCTLTVVNRNGTTFSVVRTESAERVSRILIDRTCVRGNVSAVVDASGGPVEVVLLRSLILNGQGVGFGFSGPMPSGQTLRRVSVVRTVVATRGTAFEIAPASPGSASKPVVVRSLGSTIAHFPSSYPSPLVASRAESGTPTERVDWLGDFNTLVGWSGWLACGNARVLRVTGLDGARSTWAGTDVHSRESATPWPLFPQTEKVTPGQVRSQAPDRWEVLARVPSANPFLFERTIDAFPLPDDPLLLIRPALATAPGSPNAVVAPKFSAQRFSPGGAGATMAGSPPAGVARASRESGTLPGERIVRFDTGDPKWAGDLGRFLSENVQPTDRLVRLEATGNGRFPCSPVKLPAGVSLAINVLPDGNGRIPTWVAARGAGGKALIEVHDASLVMTGVALFRDGTRSLGSLVHVAGGHLVLQRCHLRALGAVQTGGGGLIGFANPSSWEPRPDSPTGWPFGRRVDRATCLVTDTVLVTGGGVLTAEVGRGLVAFSQCAVIAGETAFSLQPANVARHRLLADLWLDRCSVASEQTFVAIGPWRGAKPGPDRPWLVSTVNCLFFGAYDRPAQDKESVLLRADADSLTLGAVFWQSSGDAIEVPYLITTGENIAFASHLRRADFRTLWTEFWGEKHVRRTTGTRANGTPCLRLVGRLRPGAVEPGDLFLAVPPPGRTAADLGVDLARLGAPPQPVGVRP